MKQYFLFILIIFSVTSFGVTEDELAKQKLLKKFNYENQYHEIEQKKAAEQRIANDIAELSLEKRRVLDNYRQKINFDKPSDREKFRRFEEKINRQFLLRENNLRKSQGLPAVDKNNADAQIQNSDPSDVQRDEAVVMDSDQEVSAAPNIQAVDPELIRKTIAQVTGQGQKENTDTSEIKDNFFTKMLNDNMKVAAAKMMRSNPFSSMDKEELRSMLVGRTAGTKLGNFLKNSPRLVTVLVDIAHDEKAIPSFISLINKPGKIKMYGFVVGSVFVIAFILNLFNSKSSLLKRVVNKFLIMGCAATINFGAFYFIFKQELQPTLNIIFQTFNLG